jgi:Uma2 family endonuclease
MVGMSAIRRPTLSLPEFLAWEEQQEFRYEFDGCHALAMTGGTNVHAAIQINLARAIGNRLDGKPCQFRGSDLKIEVAGRIRYPDGFVFCSAQPNHAKIISDPVVIFEILSDSTAAIDYGVKNDEYAATPSVRRYVILEQTRIAARMFERSGDDWIGHLLGRDSVIAMPEIGIEVPLAEFYRNIEFNEDGAESAGP